MKNNNNNNKNKQLKPNDIIFRSSDNLRMPFTHGRSSKVQLQCTVMAIMIFQNNETAAVYVSWRIYQAMLCDGNFFLMYTLPFVLIRSSWAPGSNKLA